MGGILEGSIIIIYMSCVYGYDLCRWEEGDGGVFYLSQTCILTGAGVREGVQREEWGGRRI